MNVPDLFNRSQYGSEGPIFWSQLDDRARQVVRILAVQLAEDWSPEGAAFAAQFKARTLGLGWSQAYLERLARSFIEIWEKSTDLVGPLTKVVYYAGWERRTGWALLPDSDRHPLAWNCIDHHPACACREGMFATLRREYREDCTDMGQALDAARDAFRAVLELHVPCHGKFSRCSGGGYHVGTARCRACRELWPCPTAAPVATAWAAQGPFRRDSDLVAAVLDPRLPHPLVDVDVPF